MKTTVSILERRKSGGARHARLYVVLEASRPCAGSARWSLGGTDEVRIGRGEARSGRRASIDGAMQLDIEIPDPRLSASHARIARVGAQWVLEDLGSKNGTRVNGEAVTRAVLRSGDLLEMGGTTWQYVEDLESDDDPGDVDSATLESAGFRSVVPAIARSLAQLGAISKTPVSVLITGESGTGKELAARAVHALSGRKGRFVAVNCGAVPSTLVESELFGYRRGAFSGATEDRLGLVRSADAGTLLLDEIGDLPAVAQAALLRVLQEREVLPVGATKPVPVDLRVVAATHRNLDEYVADGGFRANLLARLRGFELALPPLRERVPDLGLIVADLFGRLAPDRSPELELDAARALVRYAWPLNVRELEQALSVAVGLCGDGLVELAHLPPPVRRALASPAKKAELDADDQALRDKVMTLLREHGGNLSAVARAMGKDRKQIRRWIERFQIRVESATD